MTSRAQLLSSCGDGELVVCVVVTDPLVFVLAGLLFDESMYPIRMVSPYVFTWRRGGSALATVKLSVFTIPSCLLLFAYDNLMP